MAVSGSVQVFPYDPQIGKAQRISPLGAMLVESTEKMVGGGFVGSLDSVAWASGNNGTGSALTVTAFALMTSGTANNGYGYIQSSTKSRFHYASANLVRGTWRLQALSTPGSVQAWGAINFGTLPAILDGFYFSYDGTSNTLSVNLSNNGVVTSIPSGSFNGEVNTYTINTNAHNFEIIYQAFSAYFFIDGIFIHKFNPGTTQLTNNMALSMSSISYNTAIGTASGNLECWAQSIVRLGGVPPSPQFFNVNTLGTFVIKKGPGTLQKITLNSVGSANNTLTIYDNTAASGTKIGTYLVTASTVSVTLDYGLDFQNGLTVVSATGTSVDATIIFD